MGNNNPFNLFNPFLRTGTFTSSAVTCSLFGEDIFVERKVGKKVGKT